MKKSDLRWLWKDVENLQDNAQKILGYAAKMPPSFEKHNIVYYAKLQQEKAEYWIPKLEQAFFAAPDED